MSEITVYECGYRRTPVRSICAMAAELDAPIADIRYAVTPWGAAAPAAFEALAPGRRVHVRDLGNVNYKGGPIRLLHTERGLDTLVSIADAAGGRVIVMCACAEYESCHRRTVVEALRQRERIVILQPLSAQDGGLFG